MGTSLQIAVPVFDSDYNVNFRKANGQIKGRKWFPFFVLVCHNVIKNAARKHRHQLWDQSRQHDAVLRCRGRRNCTTKFVYSRVRHKRHENGQFSVCVIQNTAYRSGLVISTSLCGVRVTGIEPCCRNFCVPTVAG